MIHFKQTTVYCILFVVAIQIHSAPIAIAEITSNFSSAEAVFEFTGSGSAFQVMEFSSSYIRLETDAVAPQEDILDGYGTIANSIPGASAVAESNEELLVNRAEATRFPGSANSTSWTNASSYYNVENATSISLTLDIETTMELTTELPEDYAYGYIEQSVGLYWFDNGQITLLDEYSFFDGQGVFGGDNYLSTEFFGLEYSYDFEDSPYTGLLLLQGRTMAYADDLGEEPANVPEPAMVSLLILGMCVLVFIRPFPAKNVC